MNLGGASIYLNLLHLKNLVDVINGYKLTVAYT